VGLPWAGTGALGHPRVYINLVRVAQLWHKAAPPRRSRAGVGMGSPVAQDKGENVCGYCGLRFKQTGGHHGH
jgi:uncharacterized Zn-finger protein